MFTPTCELRVSLRSDHNVKWLGQAFFFHFQSALCLVELHQLTARVSNWTSCSLPTNSIDYGHPQILFIRAVYRYHLMHGHYSLLSINICCHRWRRCDLCTFSQLTRVKKFCWRWNYRAARGTSQVVRCWKQNTGWLNVPVVIVPLRPSTRCKRSQKLWDNAQ